MCIGSPVAPVGGSFNCSNSSVAGSVCNGTCSTGGGPISAECQATGNWTVRGTCDLSPTGACDATFALTMQTWHACKGCLDERIQVVPPAEPPRKSIRHWQSRAHAWAGKGLSWGLWQTRGHVQAVWKLTNHLVCGTHHLICIMSLSISRQLGQVYAHALC